MTDHARSKTFWKRVQTWGTPLSILLASLVIFGFRLGQEPHFVDESAYYAQSGYTDLLFTDRDDPAWLDYAGYDLPPLPKYLIGWSLRLFGYTRPNPIAAWQWYANTHRRFETEASLTAARLPSVLVGALGCLAIYYLGAITFDRRVGFLAALLLAFNPLYRLLSRRAMSDVPAEAFLLAALAFGAYAWTRLAQNTGRGRAMLIILGSGICVGLSVLSKLNGVISGLVLAAWAVFGMLLPERKAAENNPDAPPSGPNPTSKLILGIGAGLAGLVSFLVFVLLNPTLTAHPKPPLEPRIAEVVGKGFVDRVVLVADHRIEASRAGQKSFPNDALLNLPDKLKCVAVQGFGRFGLFGPAHSDSTKRFDSQQDWGAPIWGGVVLVGLVTTLRRGRSDLTQGAVPTSWLLSLYFLVALVTVTAYIPLAWDRYFISLQPGSCLMAAVSVVAMVDLVRNKVGR